MDCGEKSRELWCRVAFTCIKYAGCHKSAPLAARSCVDIARRDEPIQTRLPGMTERSTKRHGAPEDVEPRCCVWTWGYAIERRESPKRAASVEGHDAIRAAAYQQAWRLHGQVARCLSSCQWIERHRPSWDARHPLACRRPRPH